MKNIANKRFQLEENNQSVNSAFSDGGTLYQLCPICYSRHPITQLYSVHTCGHLVCLSCQIKNIEKNIADVVYPKCPQQNCDAKLSQESELYKLLDVPLKNKIKNIKNYRKVLANANLKPCQKANCIGLFDVTKGYICEDCGSKHCKTCNNLTHNGQCEVEVAINLQMNNKFRRCSICGSVIEKTQGCTHMQCTCGNYFCYSCGETLEGQHVCKHPQHLSFLQSVRWELEHLELWYETNSCSCLRVILLFSPPKSFSFSEKMVWVSIYCIVFYPALIVLTIILMLGTTAVMILCILVLVLLLPFIGLCANNLELFPTYDIKQTYGYCAGLLAVVLLYPLLIVMNVVQVIYQIVVSQEVGLHEILILFNQMFQGLKYVILSPCLMLVSNENFYVQNAQQQESKNPTIYLNRQLN